MRDLVLFTTNSCNLRCPSCLWALEEGKNSLFNSDKMSLGEAKKIAKHYRDHGTKTIKIQAEGEILLWPHYQEFVNYCYEIGYPATNLVTNGLTIDKHIDFILRKITCLTVSIDGYNAKTYNARRGGTKKTWVKLINNMKTFVAAKKAQGKGATLFITCVVPKQNIDYIPGMIKLADNIGAQVLKFGNFHPDDSCDLEPLYADDPGIKEKIISFKKIKHRVNVMWPKLGIRNKKGKFKFGCRKMLFHTILIGTKGDFAPCCHVHSNKKYGNYFDDPEAYKTGKLQEFRDKFRQASTFAGLPPACIDCPRLKFERKK